jgi:hypothetical protein
VRRELGLEVREHDPALDDDAPLLAIDLWRVASAAVLLSPSIAKRAIARSGHGIAAGHGGFPRRRRFLGSRGAATDLEELVEADHADHVPVRERKVARRVRDADGAHADPLSARELEDARALVVVPGLEHAARAAHKRAGPVRHARLRGHDGCEGCPERGVG